MNKYLLLNPLEPEKLSTLKELRTIEICQVWFSVSMYIRRQLLQKKVVDIGVGTFAVVPASAIVGEDKVLPVEKPVFELCRPLKKFYKLKCAKTKIPDKTLSAPLDFQEIAAEIHFRWEIVEQCIHETLLFFAGALLDSKEVEFFFQGIGILAVRRKTVRMTFFADCLLELDATGNMQTALLEDSKMRRIVAFPGKSKFARISQDGVITLPRFALEIPGEDPALSISLKPRRELAPWGGGARRVSVLDPVFLAQKRVSLSKQMEKKGMQDNSKQAGQGRLPAIQKKSEEELKHQRPSAGPELELPPCETGTEPLHARRGKQLQVLMAYKRRELEAEVWQKYHAGRMGQHLGQGQSSCRYLYEDPHCPPYLLRKAYVEKMMKERLQEQERCLSSARQRASEGWAELHLPGRAGEDAEKMRLHERRWNAQELAALPGSCEQPCRGPAEGLLVSRAATLFSRRAGSNGGQGKESPVRGEDAK